MKIVIMVFWIAILALSYLLIDYRPSLSTVKNSTQHKELSFQKSQFREVDTQMPIASAFAQRAQKINGILHAQDVHYHSDTLKSMRADRAIDDAQKVHLKGHVVIVRHDGEELRTQEAFFHKSKRLITTPGAFEATYRKHLLRGERLYYELEAHLMKAEDAHGFFVTQHL